MRNTILTPLPRPYESAATEAQARIGPGSAEATNALLEIARTLWQDKWIVAAIAAATTALAIVYASNLTPIYQSSALVIIEPDKGNVATINTVFDGGMSSREHILTQVEFLQSRNVLERVIDDMNLASHPLFDPMAAPDSAVTRGRKAVAGWLARWPALAPLAEWLTPAPRVAPNAFNRRTEVYEALSAKLSVEPVRLSQMIRVSVESEDPQLAADIANAATEAYVQAEMDARYSMTLGAKTWLEQQAANLRENLATAERALQAFRDSKGLIDARSDEQGGASRQLQVLAEQLVQARVRRTQAEQALAQARINGGRDAESAPAILANAAVGAARAARTRAQLRVAELAAVYGDAHPQYQAAVTELQGTDRALQQAVQAAVSSLAKEFGAARATEAALEGAIADVQQSIQGLNRNEVELDNYQREVDTNRQLLETFLARAKETGAASDIRSASARVVDPALPSLRPIKPRRGQIAFLGGVFGLLLGVGYVITRRRVNQTFDSIEQVEAATDRPVLAAIGKLPARKLGQAFAMLETEPQSQFSEAIRTVRTAVLLSALDNPRKIVAITSSVPGEGKSTIAFNFANALAQTGSTVFVECDMRRPNLGRLDDRLAGPGLSEAIAGTVALDDCLQASPSGGLTVLPAGRATNHPLEALSSVAFRDLVEELSSRFEAVVLDTPPIGVVSDAMLAITLSTGVVFVVRADSTPRSVVRRSLRALGARSPKLLGIVVNGLDFRRAEGYYGEYASDSTAYSSTYRTSKVVAPVAAEPSFKVGGD